MIHSRLGRAILEMDSSIVTGNMRYGRTAQDLWVLECVIAKVYIIPTTNYSMDWSLGGINEADGSVCC